MRAQTAKESWWVQRAGGDLTSDASRLPARPRASASTAIAGQCPESFGRPAGALPVLHAGRVPRYADHVDGVQPRRRAGRPPQLLRGLRDVAEPVRARPRVRRRRPLGLRRDVVLRPLVHAAVGRRTSTAVQDSPGPRGSGRPSIAFSATPTDRRDAASLGRHGHRQGAAPLRHRERAPRRRTSRRRPPGAAGRRVDTIVQLARRAARGRPGSARSRPASTSATRRVRAKRRSPRTRRTSSSPSSSRSRHDGPKPSGA